MTRWTPREQPKPPIEEPRFAWIDNALKPLDFLLWPAVGCIAVYVVAACWMGRGL